MRLALPRHFRSLGARNYRVFFVGQAISLAGTWIQSTGQAWLVLRMTHSSVALGTVTALQFLPITLLTLFGGVIADRVPKRGVLIATQVVALAQAAALGVLVATGAVALWHIYLLALLQGTVNAVEIPTRQSFVVEMAGREHLQNAVALNSSIFNGARIVGPAIAGFTIARIGVATTFFLNAASFLAVIVAYLSMRLAPRRGASPESPAPGSVVAQVAEGVAYSLRTPRVLLPLMLIGFIGTFGYNFMVIIPLVAEFVLHVGPARFGLLSSAMGVGSLAAALFLAGERATSVRFLLGAAGAFAVLLGAVAVSSAYGLSAALFAVLGFAAISFATTANTTVQLAVPDPLRGRVMSIYVFLFAGSTPVGGWLTGWLAHRFGVRAALGIEATICALGVGIALAYRAAHAASFRESTDARATHSAIE